MWESTGSRRRKSMVLEQLELPTGMYAGTVSWSHPTPPSSRGLGCISKSPPASPRQPHTPVVRWLAHSASAVPPLPIAGPERRSSHRHPASCELCEGRSCTANTTPPPQAPACAALCSSNLGCQPHSGARPLSARTPPLLATSRPGCLDTTRVHPTSPPPRHTHARPQSPLSEKVVRMTQQLANPTKTIPHIRNHVWRRWRRARAGARGCGRGGWGTRELHSCRLPLAAVCERGARLCAHA